MTFANVRKKANIVYNLFAMLLAVTLVTCAFADSEDQQAQLIKAQQRLYRRRAAESGTNAAYSYRQSSGDEDIYVVYPDDEPGYSFLVSESYLSMVQNAAGGNGEMELSTLASYENTLEGLYTHTLADAYPTNSTQDDSFDRCIINGYVIQQDQMAQPYVRITTPEGDVFSIAKHIVFAVLKNDNTTEAQKIDALMHFKYHLPENVRGSFSKFSQAEIIEQAVLQPSVADREFVRMRPIIREYEEKIMAALHTNQDLNTDVKRLPPVTAPIAEPTETIVNEPYTEISVNQDDKKLTPSEEKDNENPSIENETKTPWIWYIFIGGILILIGYSTGKRKARNTNS